MMAGEGSPLPPGAPNMNPFPGSMDFAAAMKSNLTLLHWTIVWFFVAALVVVVRVFIRTRVVKPFGWDDATMVLSMILYTVFTAILIVMIHWAHYKDESQPHKAVDSHDTGKFVQPPPQLQAMIDDLFYSRVLWQVQSLLYVTTIAVTRTSIGLLFLRVIPKETKRWARILCHIMIWITVVSAFVTFFIDLFECKPIGSTPFTGKCMDPRILPMTILVYSIISLAVDITFALMPVVILWGVKMRLSEKAGAIFLMGVGCLASATIIWRLTIIKSADFLQIEDPSQGKIAHMDPMQLQVEMLISWTIEQSLGIIGASLATYKPLFKLLREFYRSKVPPAGIFRRRRPAPIGIPHSFPAPLGSPGTPLTLGDNAYTRRMAEYENGQEYELNSSGSTGTTIFSVTSDGRPSLTDHGREHAAVSPTFPEYVYTASSQALISPTRVTAPSSRSSPHGEPIDEVEMERRIAPIPTPSPRVEREFGQTLPTIFSGEILQFSNTQSTLMSLPLDYSDLFREMPATLTESTVGSDSSGDNVGGAGSSRR